MMADLESSFITERIKIKCSDGYKISCLMVYGDHINNGQQDVMIFII